MRAVWPEHLPLTARFGVLEFDGRDEETLAESIELTRRFKAGGLDLLNVSIGFTTLNARVPWGPGFLGPIAGRVRREAGIPVASAWGFGDPAVAQKALEDGQMDLVMIGQGDLANPHWPYQAARELKIENPARVLPAPYAHWLAALG